MQVLFLWRRGIVFVYKLATFIFGLGFDFLLDLFRLDGFGCNGGELLIDVLEEMKSFCIQLSFSNVIFIFPRFCFLYFWKKQAENHLSQFLINFNLSLFEPEPLSREKRVYEFDLIILVAYDRSVAELSWVVVLINHIVNNFLNGCKGLDYLFMGKMQHLFYTLFHGLDILFEQNSAVQLLIIVGLLLLYLVILDIMDFYQGFMPQKKSFLQMFGHGFIIHYESLKEHLIVAIGYDQSLLSLLDYPQRPAHFGLGLRPDVLSYIFSYHLILLLREEHRFIQVSLFAIQKWIKEGALWLGQHNRYQYRQKRFNLNIASLKMVGDCLTNLESKVNSAEGNISTSESTHSKYTNRLLNEHNGLIAKKEYGQNMRYKLPENIEFLQQQDQEEVGNRLFTFMDERDCQKKLVQNFLVKQTNPHLCLTHQLRENNASLLNVANLALQKVIEDSKKKREDCLKKILNVNLNNKSSKSASRLSKISKNKTPKATIDGQEKYDTIQSKSRSKTPKFQQNCSITPKYNKQAKLFRAKSNLQKDWAHVIRLGKLKKQTKQDNIKKQRYQIDENECTEDGSIKALLRKKKELQRQLQAVNETITSRKKKTIPQGNNVPQSKKTTQIKNSKNRKKPNLKFAKYQ